MNDTALVTRQPAVTTAPSVRRPAIAGVALSIASLVVLLIRDTNDGPVWRVSLIVGAMIVVLTAVIFGVVVRRTLGKRSAESSARVALILGVLALLSNVVFWLAVPPLFGAAAVALALDARDRRPFRREWVATLSGVLGALGAAAGLVLSCIG